MSEPTVVVDAPDGSVSLWEPTADAPYWRAQVRPAGTPDDLRVAWYRPRGTRATYVCARCGIGHRFDHCPHCRAAVMAQQIYEKENRT